MFVRYAVLNLFRRKSRTLYAVLGIAIAISVVVAIVSASNGVQQGVVNMLNNYRGDMIIQRDGAFGVNNSDLPADLAPRLRGVQGIARVNPYSLMVTGITAAGLNRDSLRLSGLVGNDLANLGRYDLPQFPAVVLGYPLDAFVFERLTLTEGRGQFSSADAKEILLGKQVVAGLRRAVEAFFERLNLPVALRDQIVARYFDPVFKLPRPVLNGETFTVIGVFETGSYMDLQVVVPLGAFQKLFFREHRVNAYVALLEPGANVKKVVEAVEALEVVMSPLAGGVQTQPLGSGSDRANATRVQLKCDTIDNLVRQWGDETRRLQNMIFAIAVLAGIGGSISVLNTMASNVHERTREIGLLRAVGWTRRRLIASILLEGLLISLIGGTLGLGLAVIELHVAEQILENRLTPQGLQVGTLIDGMWIAVVLGTVGSLLPAWRASRLTPVEALRHE